MDNSKNSIIRDIFTGLIVGLSSGMFGVGGGIVLIPILVLLFRQAQKKAQATSLVVVSLASTAGAVTYSMANSVSWQEVPLLVVGGLVGTWIGSKIFVRLRVRYLQFAFGILLFFVAFRLILQSIDSVPHLLTHVSETNLVYYLASGLAMGALSVVFGLGGGVILVPILVTVFGFSQQLAAGTSLAVMIPVTIYGALLLGRQGFTDYKQGLRIGVFALAGAAMGAILALQLNAQTLGIAFASILLIAGLQMLWRSRSF